MALEQRARASARTAQPVYRPAPQPAPQPAAARGPAFARVGRHRDQEFDLPAARAAPRAGGQRGGQARDQLPRIARPRCALPTARSRRARRSSSSRIAGISCSPNRCGARASVSVANQIEAAKRRVGELEAQRQQIMGSAGRSYQDDIIRELARNNCGATYAQEARRRDAGPVSSIWQDDEGGGGTGGRFGALPFATYRTLCVRLCDGYCFPVSFSTLPNHFQRDAEACQSKCAAPAELYYHQNPGGSVDQMVALNSQEPLHQTQERVPLPQGARAGLLVQAGGVRAANADAGRPRCARHAAARQARRSRAGRKQAPVVSRPVP